jgi:hypothetical protein
MVNTKLAKNKNWEIGAVVKIGFMTLRVVSVEVIKDGLPDIYHLESLDGSKRYEFIPHNGLRRIEKSRDTWRD